MTKVVQSRPYNEINKETNLIGGEKVINFFSLIYYKISLKRKIQYGNIAWSLRSHHAQRHKFESGTYPILFISAVYGLPSSLLVRYIIQSYHTGHLLMKVVRIRKETLVTLNKHFHPEFTTRVCPLVATLSYQKAIADHWMLLVSDGMKRVILNLCLNYHISNLAQIVNGMIEVNQINTTVSEFYIGQTTNRKF